MQLVRDHGAGADEGHVTLQHVPELRDLVERALPQEVADAVNPRVVPELAVRQPLDPQRRVGPECAFERRVGVADHGAELPAAERLAMPSDPALEIEHLPAIGDDEHQRHDQPDRQQHRQRQQGEHLVEGGLGPWIVRAGEGSSLRNEHPEAASDEACPVGAIRQLKSHTKSG